jgi:hypothetical protein
MADSRRRFLEEALRSCSDVSLEKLLERLEEDEITSLRDPIRLPTRGPKVAIFAKLPFEDRSGTWRYGLFDAARVPKGQVHPTPPDEPFLVSKKGWRRMDFRTELPAAVERRRRTGH